MLVGLAGGHAAAGAAHDVTLLDKVGLDHILKPARLDDLLQVTMLMSERRSASFTVTQELLREGQCLLRAKVKIACLHASSFRPRALPDWVPGVTPTGEVS